MTYVKLILNQQLLDMAELELYEDGGYRSDFFGSKETKKPYFDKWSKLMVPFVNGILPKLQQAWSIPLKPHDHKEWTVWGQRYGKGTEHGFHTHGYATISACHYIEFDPEVHTATTFMPQNPDPFLGNMTSFSPKVNEGDLLFFPGTTMHSSGINTSDKTRGVIAFNIPLMNVNTSYTPS